MDGSLIPSVAAGLGGMWLRALHRSSGRKEKNKFVRCKRRL